MKAAESVEQPTSSSNLYKIDYHVILSWLYQGSFHFRPNIAFDNGPGKLKVSENEEAKVESSINKKRKQKSVSKSEGVFVDTNNIKMAITGKGNKTFYLSIL